MIYHRETVYLDTEFTLPARAWGQDCHDPSTHAGKALFRSVAMWGSRDRDRDRDQRATESHARADAAYQMAADAISQIQGHEKVCTERYTDIARQLQTMQSLLTRAGWGVVTLLIIVVGSLLSALGTAAVMLLHAAGHA